jgi:hypothetical protein
MDAFGKVEQVIRESLVKVVQVILQSRIAVPQTGKLNKWVCASASPSVLLRACLTVLQFNLGTEEIEQLTADILPWRNDLHLPIVIGIFLEDGGKNTLLEVWRFHYERTGYQPSSRASFLPGVS